MYNGIGLTTPRGSGTNGHVQRNWAFVRPKEKDKTYRTEEELCKLDTASNRPPNKEILDHERKRKIELKCAEFSEILEDQGFSEEAVKNKVNNYRIMLMGHDGKLDRPIGHWARVSVTETHHLAEAQKEKNARLREAFGISEYFVDGSSFDPDREAKEQVARSVAIQEKEQQKALERELQKDQEKMATTRYELVHTPSPEPPPLETKKKKKRKLKDSSSSDEKKKKKSKKRKKERSTKSKEKKKKSKNKHSGNSSDSEDVNTSHSDDSDSDDDDRRKKKKLKKKEKKKSAKKKRSSSESSHERSPDPPQKLTDTEKSNKFKNSGRDGELQKLNTDNDRKRDHGKYDHNKNRSDSPKYSRRKEEKCQQNSTSHRSRSRTPDQKKYLKPYREEQRLQINHTQEDRNKFSNSRPKSPNYRNYKHERHRSRSPISNNNNKRRSPSNDHKRRSVPDHDVDHGNNKHLKYETNRNNSVEGKRKSSVDKHLDRQQSPAARKKSPEAKRSPEPRRRESPEPRKSSYKKRDYPSPERRRNSYEKHEREKYRKRSRSKPKTSTERNKRRNDRKRNKSNSVQRSPDLLSHNKLEEHKSNSSQNCRSPETLMETPPRLEIQAPKVAYSEALNLLQIKTPPRELQKIEAKKSVDKSPKRKNRQQMPVVRLRSSSEDEKSDHDNENDDEEREKELRVLRLLKSGLAAKAKETLEKKIPKLKQEKTHRPTVEKVSSPRNVEQKKMIEPDSFDIRVLPLKMVDPANGKKEIRNHDCNEFVLHKTETASKKSSSSSRSRSRSHTKSDSVTAKIKKSKSRSSSRSSYSRSSSSGSSHHTTSRSPSRAHSSRSRSRSSSRSTSSDSSRSRSPSIPRRHGSPSFLDRRRITSKKV